MTPLKVFEYIFCGVFAVGLGIFAVIFIAGVIAGILDN